MSVPEIDASLVSALIARQFPQWSAQPVHPVARSGWDNRSFRIGDTMLARLPSAARYAAQPLRDWTWLNSLQPHLHLAIPEMLALGEPDLIYPFSWGVYRWIEGDPADGMPVSDQLVFARDLAGFLRALQAIDTAGAPAPGPANFYRGGPLAPYDSEARRALALLPEGPSLLPLWEKGLTATFGGPPVWVHGDVAPSNLLLQGGALAAVIDFGQLAVGDPACDYTMAWTVFDAGARAVFRDALAADDGAWARARGWALWKAAILKSGLSSSTPANNAMAQPTLAAILSEA
jgi:aminoglycoside phosphotransferase (APT) family kinase protein